MLVMTAIKSFLWDSWSALRKLCMSETMQRNLHVCPFLYWQSFLNTKGVFTCHPKASCIQDLAVPEVLLSVWFFISLVDPKGYRKCSHDELRLVGSSSELLRHLTSPHVTLKIVALMLLMLQQKQCVLWSSTNCHHTEFPQSRSCWKYFLGLGT